MMMMQKYDVVIVGGGLVGLCAAFHLIGSQRKVGVILGTQRGCASLAAAGMLAPTCEWSPETPLSSLEFLKHGRDYYREFLAQVLGHSQCEGEVGYSTRPFLFLNLLENDRRLSSRFESLQAVGANAVWLNKQEVCQLEPHLNPEAIRGAIRIVGDGVVNPQALHGLLLKRLAHHQVGLVEADLLTVEEQGNDFILRLDNEVILLCSRVIIATGAWSFEVAEKFHLNVPVSPVKGQIVQLSGASNLLKHILYLPVGACGCLLERAPGTYITGTSEEYVSVDVTNTSRVVAAILTRVNDVFLPAGDFVIGAMWSGFRPITPDEQPIISVSSDPRIILATGHFRNGVLLAPLTGLLVKALLDGDEPMVNIQPYRYVREFHAQYRFASAY